MHISEIQFSVLLEQNWLILFEFWHTFSKFFPKISIYNAKIWHKKSWYALRYNWLMLLLFIMKFRNSPAEIGWWKTFYPQAKCTFKVKLKSFSRCFGIHFPAAIREALSIVVRFDIQVKGSFLQNWRFWHFLWKTIQCLIQMVLIKKAKI